MSIVKQLTFLPMFFWVLTVGLALFNDVNRVTINQGIFDSAGIVLFLNLMFLLACAGLGATFSSLHQVFGYINDSTFDPKYNATYLLKIIMGLISGLMMAELIPLDSFADQDSPIRDLDKPLIALLGGFSSDLPYRILSRLLEVIEQLFGKNLSKPPQVKATGTSNLPKGATLEFDMPDLSKDKSESEKKKEVPTKDESKPKNLTGIGAVNKVTEAKAGSNKEG